MQRTPDLIDIQVIDSFQDIITALKELETELSTNPLPQFILFNKAYLIVTHAIQEAAGNDYFDKPEFIEKFTSCFAKYYFSAVNQTISKDSKLPFAWDAVTKALSFRTAPRFIYLMMGANAHINHDLPLALNELMNKEKEEGLLKDVLKIDKILMRSGREIIGIFDESSRVLNFLKKHLIFTYYRPAMYTILYWRIRAWRNYRSIKSNGIKNSGYTKFSVKISHRLIRLAKLLARI